MPKPIIIIIIITDNNIIYNILNIATRVCTTNVVSFYNI